MPQKFIDQLIINSPYAEPSHHWRYDRESRLFDLVEGRRKAGYLVATPHSKAFDDPGIFVPIPLVNTIRPRVQAWRDAGYPGVSSITKRLLEHWHDPEEFNLRRFFFCQLEAVETLIWLREASATDQVGIGSLGDGGAFSRECCKMATGSGKTIVMAMVIAWHTLNKVASPQDARFSKNVLVVAPGLTVKNRLAVLAPAAPGNYYHVFNIVPSAMMDKLRQAKVLVTNWHTLGWETEEQIKKRHSVDKRGVKSDEAYIREVLGEMAQAHNVLVINDEAHHAWRVNPEAEGKYERDRDHKDSAAEATIWVGGLDRVHRSRSILQCYDFSATPFPPSGKRTSEEALFDWIVSDFGLNDAIESGLVKTPRVVVRDDAVADSKLYKSRLYHIYNDSEVKDDLNRKAPPDDPLPDLVQQAYELLGSDWREAWKAWSAAGQPTPPVMITVCNRTETAARIKHTFESKRVHIDELCVPELILHIDSKVLKKAEDRADVISPAVPVESGEVGDIGGEGNATSPPKRGTKAEQAERLRQMVDTVGQEGELGADIRNVISVGMLSEGWDAKTVTHIMGLRAFTSQLLCEQVVGRGLRRTAYEINPNTLLFDAEYVNVFGVPFSFLPHEGSDNGAPPPPPPKTRVAPDPKQSAHEISWPNVLRIEHILDHKLELDWETVEKLALDASKIIEKAGLAPVVDGKPDVSSISRIEFERMARERRLQRIIFEVARDIYDKMQPNWQGGRAILLAQLVRIIEEFITSKCIAVIPSIFNQDELRRNLIITLNMRRIVEYIWTAIRQENYERLEPVLDTEHPIGRTGDMPPWYTAKPCDRTIKSHINFCVYDSTWEKAAADALDNSEHVLAWVKNDHLGFEVLYTHLGIVRKYRPDFLVKLANGDMFVLEIKGQVTDQARAKYRHLEEWVKAVTSHGGFGTWACAMATSTGELLEILTQAAPSVEAE